MPWLRKFRRLLWEDPFDKWFLTLLIIVNALGSVWGYLWYRQQLAETPWPFWIFTPDSPLSTTLMAVALLTLLVGRPSALFLLLAYTAVIKYGLWAIVLITDYWLRGGPIAFTESMLWLSHLGMAVEGFLYLRHLRVTAGQAIFTGVWMALNDFMDYGLGLHPYLFLPEQRTLAMASAVALTVMLFLAGWRKK